MPTRATADARERRSREGLWLGIGLVALLLGYPLGLILAGMGTRDWWTPAYVVLALVALGAAFAFTAWARRRRGPP